MTSFRPGAKLRIPKSLQRTALPVLDRVRTTSPGRLHFSVLDYACMAPDGIAAGGGVGISTALVGHDIVVEHDIVPRGSPLLPATARHVLALFKRATSYPLDDLRISIQSRNARPHAGLGTNVSLNTGLFCALNRLFGKIFSDDEMYRLLSHNYVESSAPDAVHWGYETGVGEACVLYGGFNLVDRTGVHGGTLPAGPMRLVLAHGIREKLSGSQILGHLGAGADTQYETFSINTFGLDHQKRFAVALDALHRHTLAPAFQNQDWPRLLEGLWRLNEIGSFRRKLSSFQAEVLLGFTAQAKALGALYAGMSSAGPSMFALAPSEEVARSIALQLEAQFKDYFFDFELGQVGSCIQYNP